jgi:Fe-S cluster assembly iron-binding protein IscA
MVISELAKTKITKLLQQENANLLKILLAGNASVGFQTIITFETARPKEFITITTEPLVVTDPRSYVQLANSLLDFDDQTNELKFKM